MTDAVRRARGDQIGIAVTQNADSLILVIEGNGEGSDVAEAIRRGGLGIVAMRERVEMLDGELTIESTRAGNGRLH